jgi:cysteinyl-tRNA synthetase
MRTLSTWRILTMAAAGPFHLFLLTKVEAYMVKKILAAVSIASALVAIPSVAHATCTLTGVIVRVTQYDDAYTAIGGYIYFRTSSLASYYYYVATNDDDSVSNAIAHMNSGRTVTIQGAVAACPAVPAAGGAGYLGTLNYMYNP